MLLSSGSEQKTVAINPGSENKGELRGSTKPLQVADLVGYDGTKLKKSVDHIKEANEKHNQDVEKMAESGPDQERRRYISGNFNSPAVTYFLRQLL